MLVFAETHVSRKVDSSVISALDAIDGDVGETLRAIAVMSFAGDAVLAYGILSQATNLCRGVLGDIQSCCAEEQEIDYASRMFGKSDNENGRDNKLVTLLSAIQAHGREQII